MIITDPATGQQHCIDGCLVYSCNPIIHRDPNIYGDSAGYFMPERWLTHSNNSSPGLDMDAASSGVGGKIPPSAWRPFERGPRSCLGQDLAILEARVVLALVARHFEFEKVGAGRVVVDEGGEAVVDEESGQFRVVPDLYNVRTFFFGFSDKILGLRMLFSFVELTRGLLTNCLNIRLCK